MQNNNFFWSGIINLLFDGLAYNTSGHFAHHARIFRRPCVSLKNTSQLAKYPHVLYAKPSYKVYVFIFGRLSSNLSDDRRERVGRQTSISADK